jgi:hypothetical protein
MALKHGNADFFQVHVVVGVGLEALNQISIIFFRSAGYNFLRLFISPNGGPTSIFNIL